MNRVLLPGMVICVEMGNAVMVCSPPWAGLGHRQWLIAGTVGFIATIWLVVLSGWLGVTHGSLITKRRNVLFDSDMNVWLDRMIGNDVSLEQSVHPLELILWRQPCRAVAAVLKPFIPSDDADVLGPRILVAFIAGLGVASLALLALYAGVKPRQGALLAIVYLLFTTNTTICLPEHFGISNGILTMSFVAIVLIASWRIKMAVLGAAAVVLGGTSLANGLFPLGCMFDMYFKSTRVKIRLFLSGTILAAAGLACVRYFGRNLRWLAFQAEAYSNHFGRNIHTLLVKYVMWLYLTFVNIRWFFRIFAVYRWTRHPLLAIVYTIYMFVQPAVAPNPSVMRYPFNDMVSYEPALKPLELSYYFGLQGFGAVAWLILLGRCAYFAWQDEHMRPYVKLLFGWLLFNVVFYNIWGRELLLWAPHWSWALMALVVLGARKLSWRFVAAVFVPVVVSQIYTLFAIKSALLTITQ
jgi:hypothetical protein